jgi:LysM repeat protein
LKSARAAISSLCALSVLASAGCSTSSKLAEAPAYDISKGDYLTEEEYKELSRDEAQEYCEALAQEIDIQTDNASFAEESLSEVQAEIEDLRTRLAAAKPPEIAETPGAATESYTVMPGDWLSKIAAKFYGNWRTWQRIFDANRDQIRNPDLIYPRQVFSIPR